MADGKKYADLSQGRNAWTAHKTGTPEPKPEPKPESHTAHKTGTPATKDRKDYGRKSTGEVIAQDFADRVNKKGSYKPVKPFVGEDRPNPAPDKAIVKDTVHQIKKAEKYGNRKPDKDE